MEEQFFVEMVVSAKGSEPVVIPHLIRAATQGDAIQRLVIRVRQHFLQPVVIRIPMGAAHKYRAIS